MVTRNQFLDQYDKALVQKLRDGAFVRGFVYGAAFMGSAVVLLICAAKLIGLGTE